MIFNVRKGKKQVIPISLTISGDIDLVALYYYGEGGGSND